MTRKLILSVLCFCMGMNAAAWSSLYLGAGATWLNVRSTKVSSSSYKGIAPAIYLGYGGWMNEYLYLAWEGSASFDFSKTGHDETLVNLKPKYYYGIALVPAFNLDNTIIAYFRLGIVRADFQDVEKAKNGWQAGVGLEVPLYCNVSIRGEYDYAAFKVNEIGTVQSNEGSLSLIYRFEPILANAYGLLT